MHWKIKIDKNARKYLLKYNIQDKGEEAIIKFLKFINGEDINLDVKRLKGKFKEYYRIRIGKIRIILRVNFKDKIVFVEMVEKRGDIY